MAISVRAPEGGLAAVPALTTAFVVPAFNEADNILRLFSDLEQHPQLFGPDSRLLIVDDGSADATADLVESYDGPLPVECLRMGVNQGPGAAFRAGFREVLDDSDEEEFLIVTLEADTTSDLATLPTMLARAEGGADLVLASVHGGGKMVGVNPLRRVLSAGAGVAMRRALQVDARTVSSFFRVYRASVLRRGFEHYGDDLLRERGFACKAEILANLVALGATITEVPDGPRRIAPRGCEQDAHPADDGRLLAPGRTPARREGVVAAVTRVGIVGGGLMGLATAYRLAQAGVQVDVMERADGLGGLMSSFDFDGHHVDRFYHVVLPTDDRVLGLAEELGLRDQFRFRPVGVGFWDRERLFSISSTKEFLRFPLLSPLQRLRLGAFVVRCNRRKGHDDLDGMPLLPWLEKQCGKGVVDRLWRPLLDSKFDGRYDDLPATYMWARTRRMAGTRDGAGREIMGTLEGGYQRMIDALADRIRSLGGSIETGMTVTDIEPADGGGATLRAGGESRRFDLVFSTLLPEQGRRLLGAEYAAAAPADHCRYLGVLCLIVRTRESVSPYYTLSLTDRSVGLTTVVETTHVTDPASVGGHLLYVTKYVDPSHELLTADAAEVERDVPRRGAAHPAGPRRGRPSSARPCSARVPSSRCTSSAARAGCPRCSPRPAWRWPRARTCTPRSSTARPCSAWSRRPPRASSPASPSATCPSATCCWRPCDVGRRHPATGAHALRRARAPCRPRSPAVPRRSSRSCCSSRRGAPGAT